MSHLEQIQQLIDSPAFGILSEEAQCDLLKLKKQLMSDEYDEDCEETIKAFKNIHRNKTKGCFAPHKPVLLLAVIDLINSGHIENTTVDLDKELKQHFKEVWQETVPKACTFKCEYRNPFTYLDYEPFWHLCDDKNTAILSGVAYECMRNPQKRAIIRDCLLWMIKNETVVPRIYSINDSAPAMAAEKIFTLTPLFSTALMTLFA